MVFNVLTVHVLFGRGRGVNLQTLVPMQQVLPCRAGEHW